MGDKLREMKLAIALEKEFTKDQILEGYLNIVFFNRDAYGIEAASQYFFSTTAKDLTLPQAALLAGLVNSPGLLRPHQQPGERQGAPQPGAERHAEPGQDHPGRARRRRGHPGGAEGHPGRAGLRVRGHGPVLLRLRPAPAAEQPGLRRRRQERERKIFRGGLTITTTLDPEPQAAAQDQVNATAGANPDKWGAALVSVQPGTGKILAMAQNTVVPAGRGRVRYPAELQRGQPRTPTATT